MKYSENQRQREHAIQLTGFKAHHLAEIAEICFKADEHNLLNAILSELNRRGGRCASEVSVRLQARMSTRRKNNDVHEDEEEIWLY